MFNMKDAKARGVGVWGVSTEAVGKGWHNFDILSVILGNFDVCS